MPAWPGGACPGCGEDMPANLVHCQTCRTLLNPELDRDTVEVPVFVPLQEISSMLDATAEGYYAECGSCRKELKFKRKYLGKLVECKFCQEKLKVDQTRAVAFYSNCPHCDARLKNSSKYLGKKVACKHCAGHIHFVN